MNKHVISNLNRFQLIRSSVRLESEVISRVQELLNAKDRFVLNDRIDGKLFLENKRIQYLSRYAFVYILTGKKLDNIDEIIQKSKELIELNDIYITSFKLDQLPRITSIQNQAIFYINSDNRIYFCGILSKDLAENYLDTYIDDFSDLEFDTKGFKSHKIISEK